ncbi:glycosyltransferase [Parasediminibacterium sp. JCM 36343]|uniref:glycosyltransferase n=1 Tax=Parasediminibacterium sp. JCM 36343 TaxID=3374279 RepID=UPI003977FD1D
MGICKLTVIICTYKPNLDIFNRILAALKQQTFGYDQWELIIVDNNSPAPLDSEIDISWHPFAKIIIEQQQGLAFARIRGVKEASTELIVFIDDDNVAQPNYLQQSLSIASLQAEVGVFGGKALPDFYRHQPADWVKNAGGLLGCRDFGNIELISNTNKKNINEYPYFSPIGTGMCIRKQVFENYVNEIKNDSFRQNLGRKAAALTSGEDNDIVITALKNGWQVGYFPQLEILHIIPAKRTTPEYLGNMNYAQNKSWATLLQYHGISPWQPIAKWTVPLRKIKAWVSSKAWQSSLNYMKWRGICGMFDGMAEIKAI